MNEPRPKPNDSTNMVRPKPNLDKVYIVMINEFDDYVNSYLTIVVGVYRTPEEAENIRKTLPSEANPHVTVHTVL